MWARLLIVLVLNFHIMSQTETVSLNLLGNVAQYYRSHGILTPKIKNFLVSTNRSYVFRSDAKILNNIACLACKTLVGTIIKVVKYSTASVSIVEGILSNLCKLFLFDETVCVGTISHNAKIISHIIQIKPDISARNICAIILQDRCGDALHNWSINIPEGSSEINKGIISKTTPLKVLHLTDIHYDPFYEAGSLGHCEFPVCCTVGTVPHGDEGGAGYWGDYHNCDTPLYAIEDALRHIASQHPDISYIYFTGDLIHHRVWNTSISANSADMTKIFGKIKGTFPNVTVFSILGNHEPHPLNVFAPLNIKDESFSTQWLFNLSADIWGQWLNEYALETVRKGGYYTISPQPGFRIIALNNNVALSLNWWLIYDDVDPYGQLQWLSDTLYTAEQNREKVHILVHIPSTDSQCHKIWSREYRRILERFSGTISATFTGHTHFNGFVLYHSRKNPMKPIGIAWDGGSLTTYSNRNPNYKVYQVDARSYEVLDYDVWTYNITAANLTPKQAPEWFKLYSLKKDYNLSGVSLQDIKDLTNEMAANRTIMEQYFNFGVRNGDTSLAEGCDSECLREKLFELVRSEALDNTLVVIPSW